MKAPLDCAICGAKQGEACKIPPEGPRRCPWTVSAQRAAARAVFKVTGLA